MKLKHSLHKILLLTFVMVMTCVTAALGDGSRLAVGDIVGITVDGEKEFSKPYQINDEGNIILPMNVGAVNIAGTDTSEAAAIVTHALKKVLKNPQVTIVFMDRAKMNVFVVGQVQNPGLVQVGVGDTLIQAIAQAGYDDTADLSGVTVRRGDQVISCDLSNYLSANDLSANIELLSGDTVVVPRTDEPAGSVMVVGQVAKVGSITIKENMTFSELMGLVGGVTIEADTSKIILKREGKEPIPVDYKKAMARDPEADITLQDGDMIQIPELEKSFFTVMGGVARPGQYPLKGDMKLSEAIGLAGGAVPNLGDLRKVQVMRGLGTEGEPSSTEMIDLQQIIKGGGKEPQVERGDVIYVTEHKPKPNVLDVIKSLLPLGWIFR